MSIACLSGRDIESFVIDVNDYSNLEDLLGVLSGREFYGWNANFDAHVLDKLFGCDTRIKWWDGMIADALLYQGMHGFKFYHSLAWASDRYLGTTLTGKGTTQTSFTKDDPLTEEQVRYAAEDAVSTVRVCAYLHKELRNTGLEFAAELEFGARPFLDHMERYGIALDWDGWSKVLAEKELRLKDKLSAEIAELMGVGQPTLFGGLEPVINPASTADLKFALNDVAPEAVMEYTQQEYGHKRLLQPSDKLDTLALKQIDHPLAKAILRFKEDKKVLSTYGANLKKHLWDDGRMRPSYMQVVGTGTGRLSSRNPNAQNLTPLLKPFFKPPTGRVFVYADLSQAELRFLAELSQDETMRRAFREGRDIHEATAEAMLGIDMAVLKASDPKQYKEMRSIGKALNFSIVYGLGGRTLAKRLTIDKREAARNEGLPTEEVNAIEVTPEEGFELIEAYRAGYPLVAAWLDDRARIVSHAVATLPEIDWRASVKLYDTLREIGYAPTRYQKKFGHRPDGQQLAEFIDQYSRGADLREKARRFDWAMKFEAAVVLENTDTPYTLFSHTDSGRRRHFNIPMDRIYETCIQLMLRSDKPATVKTIVDTAARFGATLSPSMNNDEIFEVFKGKGKNAPNMKSIVEACGEGRKPWVLDELMNRALANRVGALTNAVKNNPIQGGVGDAVLLGYSLVWQRILDSGLQDVYPVQTVHDSVTLECNEADASAVCEILRSSLEDGFSRFCPNVPAKADASVLTSLDEADRWAGTGTDQFDRI